ncbi:hypothetical protein BDZ91DRAFT_793887 [Kalaharituber pfeilii]|nr:hypothetical protein BDZ91DRAFT_793887 [Kalaharituber pfeilii]
MPGGRKGSARGRSKGTAATPPTAGSTSQATPKSAELVEESSEEEIPRVVIKKAKVAYAPREPFNTVMNLYWVPADMRVDILSAQQNNDEVNGCINFYIRCMTWCKRSITAENRLELIQYICGLSKDKAMSLDKDGLNHDDSFGAKITDQIKRYHNNLIGKLRENFDALLGMFWGCSQAKEWVEANLALNDAQQKVNQNRNSSIRPMNPALAIIDENEINEWFIHGNMRLINDVWCPIMDVVPQDYFFSNTEWAQRLLKSTCLILSWLVTYHMSLPNARESLKNPQQFLAAALRRRNGPYRGCNAAF